MRFKPAASCIWFWNTWVVANCLCIWSVKEFSWRTQHGRIRMQLSLTSGSLNLFYPIAAFIWTRLCLPWSICIHWVSSTGKHIQMINEKSIHWASSNFQRLKARKCPSRCPRTRQAYRFRFVQGAHSRGNHRLDLLWNDWIHGAGNSDSLGPWKSRRLVESRSLDVRYAHGKSAV